MSSVSKSEIIILRDITIFDTVSDLPAPDTCAVTLNTNGDALYALAGSNSNNNGIVLVRLTPAGAVHTSILRQESIVPRFLAAFRYIIKY